jgi:hypothetical protein
MSVAHTDRTDRNSRQLQRNEASKVKQGDHVRFGDAFGEVRAVKNDGSIEVFVISPGDRCPLLERRRHCHSDGQVP